MSLIDEDVRVGTPTSSHTELLYTPCTAEFGSFSTTVRRSRRKVVGADGEVVGEVVGELVGEIVGEVVGELVVGEVVGELVVGEVVGELVVGTDVGADVGAAVGGNVSVRTDAIPKDRPIHTFQQLVACTVVLIVTASVASVYDDDELNAQ
jgi:hypothetical protein